MSRTYTHVDPAARLRFLDTVLVLTPLQPFNHDNLARRRGERLHAQSAAACPKERRQGCMRSKCKRASGALGTSALDLRLLAGRDRLSLVLRHFQGGGEDWRADAGPREQASCPCAMASYSTVRRVWYSTHRTHKRGVRSCRIVCAYIPLTCMSRLRLEDVRKLAAYRWVPAQAGTTLSSAACCSCCCCCCRCCLLGHTPQAPLTGPPGIDGLAGLPTGLPTGARLINCNGVL